MGMTGVSRGGGQERTRSEIGSSLTAMGLLGTLAKGAGYVSLGLVVSAGGLLWWNQCLLI